MRARPEAGPVLPGGATLGQLQRLLGTAFAAGATIDAAHADAEAIGAAVAVGPRLGALEQADIYREQFWLRHRDCLYEDYPGLVHLLGAEPFERFCRAYLDARPPRSFTLRDLGDDLADFAARYPDFAPEVAGAARDMVRFERAFVDIFDGPDADGIEPATLAATPPERAARSVVVMHLLLTLLELAHPVHELRTALRAAERDGAALPPRRLDARPVRLAMWRGADLRVSYRELEEGELALVRLLARGLTLERACSELLAPLSPEQAQRAAAAIGGWMRAFAERGWIVALHPAWQSGAEAQLTAAGA